MIGTGEASYFSYRAMFVIRPLSRSSGGSASCGGGEADHAARLHSVQTATAPLTNVTVPNRLDRLDRDGAEMQLSTLAERISPAEVGGVACARSSWMWCRKFDSSAEWFTSTRLMAIARFGRWEFSPHSLPMAPERSGISTPKRWNLSRCCRETPGIRLPHAYAECGRSAGGSPWLKVPYQFCSPNQAALIAASSEQSSLPSNLRLSSGEFRSRGTRRRSHQGAR